MKRSIPYTLVLVVAFAWISCKKSEHGTGVQVDGSITLEVHAVHHSWDVSGIRIYLKKNVTDFPGTDTTVYEYSGQADGYGKFEFEKLYPGNYYVYATGFDAIWGDTVVGYMPAVLEQSTLTDNRAAVTLIVSE